MTCPQCAKVPNSYLDQFRFGGVGFRKYLQGFIKCRHCGSMLRVLGFEKIFWLVFPTVLVLAFLAGILFDFVMTPFKSKPIALFISFLLYIILVSNIASLVVWKYRRLTKADVANGTEKS